MFYLWKKVSVYTDHQWFTKFSSGQEAIKDAPYSGRPKYVCAQCNINKSN